MCACTCPPILPCGSHPCSSTCPPPPRCCKPCCPPPCPCTPCPPCRCRPVFRPCPPPLLPDYVGPVVPVLPPSKTRRLPPKEPCPEPPTPPVYCPPMLPPCPPPEPPYVPPTLIYRPDPIRCYQPVLPCCNPHCPTPILPKQRPICPRAPPCPFPCVPVCRRTCPVECEYDPVTQRRPLIVHDGIFQTIKTGNPAMCATRLNPNVRYKVENFTKQGQESCWQPVHVPLR